MQRQNGENTHSLTVVGVAALLADEAERLSRGTGQMNTLVSTRAHNCSDNAVIAVVLAATVGARAGHQHGIGQVGTVELDGLTTSLDETARVVDRDGGSAALLAVGVVAELCVGCCADAAGEDGEDGELSDAIEKHVDG